MVKFHKEAIFEVSWYRWNCYGEPTDTCAILVQAMTSQEATTKTIKVYSDDRNDVIISKVRPLGWLLKA